MKTTKLKLALAAIVLLVLLPALAQAQGTVPTTVSYQGRVTVGGEPFHGDGLFKFAILDSQGRSTWSNDGTSTDGSEPADFVWLWVEEGLFNVLLGDSSLMEGLRAEVFADPTTFLRVWFSPDGGEFIQLDDRPIAAVPYAFNADRVDGLDAADFAAATHDHWGETWSGSGTGLTLNSSGGGPTLNISNGDNDAIYVPSAGGNGVEVHAAGEDGFYVSTAGDDGMQIGFQTWLGDYVGASDDGIVIYDAGNAPTHTLPVDVFGVDTHDGIDIAGAADFGLWVGSAGRGGVLVNNTEGNGFTVVDAGSAGVHVDSAGSDGVYVGFVGGNGVYVMSADWDGVFANTARNDHEWGFDTPDKIQAMNVTMRSLSVIARNDGPVSLQAGDLVAVTGVDRPLLGGSTPMPNVRRADGRFTGVIGVVESRMELTVVDPMEEWAERAEAPPNVKPEDVIHEEAHSATGDAAPGEYVSIVVFGITDVKVDATAGAIEPGQRLTAANLAGHARGLQSRLLDGMLVTEGAPTIGIALEPLEKGTGAIPVFVTLQ